MTTTTLHDHDADEAALLAAARRGDEGAFARLVGHRRAELHAHCYRMLASPEDAEDAVQEALVRAWRGLSAFEGRSSLRTWLFRITTNAALDIARRRGRRELPVSFQEAGSSGELGEWDLSVPWIGPFVSAGAELTDAPDARYSATESIELAFVAGLQHLPVQQRAVFILREALGFSAAEAADVLDTTVAGVNSALQRARVTLSSRLPAHSQRSELQRLGDAAVRELAARYARAIEQADLPAILELLTEDASWSMPPLPTWFQGTEDVSGFLTRFVFPERWRHVTTEANGQLAVAGYLFDDEVGGYVPAALDVLEVRRGCVASVVGFLTNEALTVEERAAHEAPPALFERFGLPGRLPAETSPS